MRSFHKIALKESKQQTTQQFWLQIQVTKSLTSISLRLRNAVIVYFRMIQLLSLKTFHLFIFPPSLFVLLNQWTWTERVYIEPEVIVIELNNAGYWNSFIRAFYFQLLKSRLERQGIISYSFILCCNVNLEVLFSLILKHRVWNAYEVLLYVSSISPVIRKTVIKT